MKKKRKGIDIPKKITVLGEVYKIYVVEGLMETDGLEGFCSGHEHKIAIDVLLVENPRVFWKVFWHEVGHALQFESGLHDSLSPDGREFFCQAFSQLMRDIKKAAYF